MCVNHYHFCELCSRITIIRRDIGLIYSLLTAQCVDLSLLIDYRTFFKDVIYL